MTADRGTALIHRALVYAGDDEFLAAAVPFLRAGLTADNTVLVAAPTRRHDVVRGALGPDAEPLLFVDSAQWYQHPVRAIAAYDQFLRTQAPRRVHALAELDWTDWADRWSYEVREWMRYEAVVNAIFSMSGARGLCAYDRAAAPPDVVAEVRRTHPEIVEGGRPRHNAGYVDPVQVFAEFDREPLRLPAVFESIPIESATDLHDVRIFVAARATRYGLPRGAALNGLLVAVTELATNAVKHGTPPMAVRVWAEEGDLICEVADCGRWRPAAMLGFAPPASAASGGFGLWGVRMLTDLVQIRAGWDGTVVRIRTRLSSGTRPHG